MPLVMGRYTYKLLQTLRFNLMLYGVDWAVSSTVPLEQRLRIKTTAQKHPSYMK